MMTENDAKSEWVWAVIEKKGNDESLYALEDESAGLKFIPVFRNQEEGKIGLKRFEKREGYEYELEAMRVVLAAETAEKNKMDLLVIDHEGKVIEKLEPILDA